MVDLDAAGWTALGTWILVIGTLALMYWQTRENRALNSANAVMTLRERFDAPHLRRARKLLAQRLLANQHDDVTNLEVGAFFELVGTLTRHRVLDEELVWEAFGTWAVDYWIALRNPVDVLGRARTNLSDPLILHEFEWLHSRIEAIDRRMLGTEHSAVLERESEVRALLEREAGLDL